MPKLMTYAEVNEIFQNLCRCNSKSNAGSIQTIIQFNELGYGEDYMADIRRGYCDFWDEIDEYMEH